MQSKTISSEIKSGKIGQDEIPSWEELAKKS